MQENKRDIKNYRIFKFSNFRKGFEGFATYVLVKKGVSSQTSLCPILSLTICLKSAFKPGTKILCEVSTSQYNQYWKLHWPWLLNDLPGNHRTLGYCAPLTSEQPENACCHKSETSLALLTTPAINELQFHSTISFTA